MKQIIFLIFIIGIYSCKPKISEEIIAEYPNGEAQIVHIFQERGRKKELIKEITYYNNGQKKQEGQFNAGLRTGKWIHYYDSGQIWSEGFFIKDKREGESIVYYKNGSINYKGAYKNGEPTGEWMFYDEYEKKEKIVIYEDGKIKSEEYLTVPFK